MINKLSITKKKILGWFNTSRALVCGFGLIILLGSLLLMLPFATKSGGSISFLNALFTSTSATCVTGLVVFNTFQTFTFFGQFVILLLIQIGGLGIMTISSSIYILMGSKISLRQRISIKEDLQQNGLSELKGLILNIIRFAFIAETVGAVILTICFTKYYSFGEALWRGIFHSISAYCNAGFDIINIGDGSMTPFYDNPFILLTICALIIVGGLGFLVITDIYTKKHWRKLLPHSKIVLLVTLFLLIGGTVGIFASEYNNPQTIGNMNLGQKLLNSFFHSTTTRTAGFNSFSIRDMSMIGLLITIVLMFIGASPSSTGGGLKTSTLFVLIAATFTVIGQKPEPVVNMKKINKLTVYKACTILFLALTIMIISLFVLIAVDGDKFSMAELIFEQVSAYATVGLSTGITADLSVASKFVLIFNMFLGRVGVISFFIAFITSHTKESKIQYLDANVRL